MGLKISPYQMIRTFLLAEEVIQCNCHDPGNTIQWEQVRLNLPESKEYDPCLPWVSKVRVDNWVAVDFVTYVDDIRAMGGSRLECWMASRRVSQLVAYLGIQDAATKQ
jgi:hypothetical protein